MSTWIKHIWKDISGDNLIWGCLKFILQLLQQTLNLRQTRNIYCIKYKHVKNIYHAYNYSNKKHLKNVGPIRHCEPFYIAIHQVLLLSHAATVARRLRIDVHNDAIDNNNDNAWLRGPLWFHRMGQIMLLVSYL